MKFAFQAGTGLTKIDVYATLEELPEDFENFGPIHVQLTRKCKSLRHVLSTFHRLRHALLEEAEFGTLGNGMTDGQLDHVVGSGKKCDHIVEDARAFHVGAVLEVELLSLKVVLIKGPSSERHTGLILGKCQVCQNILLLVLREVPKHNYAI